MTDELSADIFRSRLNETFRIATDQRTVDAELIEVRGLKSDTKRADRSPFSLLFRGPEDAPLEQQIFAVENDELGRLEIFLVTVGPDPDEDGMLYEAVFT